MGFTGLYLHCVTLVKAASCIHGLVYWVPKSAFTSNTGGQRMTTAVAVELDISPVPELDVPADEHPAINSAASTSQPTNAAVPKRVLRTSAMSDLSAAVEVGLSGIILRGDPRTRPDPQPCNLSTPSSVMVFRCVRW